MIFSPDFQKLITFFILFVGFFPFRLMRSCTTGHRYFPTIPPSIPDAANGIAETHHQGMKTAKVIGRSTQKRATPRTIPIHVESCQASMPSEAAWKVRTRPMMMPTPVPRKKSSPGSMRNNQCMASDGPYPQRQPQKDMLPIKSRRNCRNAMSQNLEVAIYLPSVKATLDITPAIRPDAPIACPSCGSKPAPSPGVAALSAWPSHVGRQPYRGLPPST